jgi:hypothetical protein
MRTIAGLLVGLVAAIAAIWAVGLIGGQFFAIDAPTDPRQSSELAAALGSAPPGLKIFLVLSWFAGGLVGAGVAKWVARMSWPAWAVAACLALLLASTFLVPLPIWMQVLAVVAPLVGALLADLLVKVPPRREAEAADDAHA